jgi:hypothetical protein
LARPLPVPVDLSVALRPLVVLYRAIAVAAGGTLDMAQDAEHMFVQADGDTVRALLSEALDVTIGTNLEVSGKLGDSDGFISLRMIGGAGRPIAARMERFAAEQDVRITSDEDETALLFPGRMRAGVDSNT